MSLKDRKEIFDDKWGSKCKKDYKQHHFWEKLGVVLDRDGDVYMVLRCSQCRLCIYEPLEFL